MTYVLPLADALRAVMLAELAKHHPEWVTREEHGRMIVEFADDDPVAAAAAVVELNQLVDFHRLRLDNAAGWPESLGAMNREA